MPLLDILFILIEEGCNNKMIGMVLRNKGYSEKEISDTICSAGIGQGRKELIKKCKSWQRERFESMRK